VAADDRESSRFSSLNAGLGSTRRRLRYAVLEKGGRAFGLMFSSGGETKVWRFEQQSLGLAGVHPLFAASSANLTAIGASTATKPLPPNCARRHATALDLAVDNIARPP
jgi:hypothetical protein